MPAPFNYENSEKHGVRVSRVGEENLEDHIKTALKKGDRLTVPNQISDGKASVKVENGEVKVSVNGETVESMGGNLVEVFGDLQVHGDVQRLGKRIEVWQNVVSTGDNLIELNANIDGDALKVPYSGIEVNRGKEQNVFLLYKESSARWTVVKNGKDRPVALHGDPLSSFKQNLTTDDISEGEENRYARPSKDTHNFWVSDNVTKTKGEDKKILPAFVSIGKQEKKFVTKVRAKLSAGTAGVALLLNGEQKGDPVQVDGYADSQMELPLEDGDEIGVAITEASGARNLSVSIEVTRYNQ